ncbi:MAG: MBOAT family O-acyltransferase [Lachnospiraceae bacterium]
MLFNSYLFIFIFFPLVFVGWFFLNAHNQNKWAKAFLAGMSLWFYSYANIHYLFLILASVCVNYFCSYAMKKWNRKTLFHLLGIIFNLGLLFYFKYYDFFISNINLIFRRDFTLLHIALPLGISFFTFQQISFLCDRKRENAPHYPFLDYLCFVTYFPQLVAGPIVKHNLLIPQFSDSAKWKPQPENIARGILLFSLGLAKKLLLADNLALAVDWGYENVVALDSITTLLLSLFYSFQIFFDFSGYCDMALGMAMIMNICLPVNFDSPYKSRSIKEFWNRWHITLNQFFTEYVYIPLGGNRKGIVRTVCNVLLVFFLSGLWHGANWTFVLWGVAHGIVLAIQRIFEWNRRKCEKPQNAPYETTVSRQENMQRNENALRQEKMQRSENALHRENMQHEERAFHISVGNFLCWFFTFSFVNLAWILFRSSSIAQAGEVFRILFSFTWNGAIVDFAYSMDSSFMQIPLSLLKRISGESVPYFYVAYMLCFGLVAAICCMQKSALRFANSCKMKPAVAIGAAILFVLSVFALSNTSPFLYSNF